MTRRMVTRGRRERGAVLVHVAVAMMALVAFCALTIDYGIMWMSRRQAQNAADSGAMAGAISLAFDDPDGFDRARSMAKTFAESHSIFGLAPSVALGSGNDSDTTKDISFPSCPPDAPGLPDTCVRVNVYRTSADYTQGGGAKDPLPTFFGPLFGRLQQGVRATATAQVLTGNASACLKPWGIADKWEEHWDWQTGANNGAEAGTWTTEDTFDKWVKEQGTWTSDPAQTGFEFPDYYRAPGTNGSDDPGTGFRPFNDGVPTSDYGLELTLKLGGNSPNERISSGWFLALDLDLSENPEAPQNSGAQKYGWAISNCSAKTEVIGTYIDAECGNMAGPTEQNTYGSNNPNDELGIYEKDPTAEWDPVTKTIINSCAPGICNDNQFHSYSPRIVPVPVFDINEYLTANPTGCNPGTSKIKITNIMGFFVLPDNSGGGGGGGGGGGQGEVRGVLVAVPGLTVGASTIPSDSAFLRQVILVR